MKKSWTQGLDEQKSVEIKQDFKGCFPTRKRLSELLKVKIDAANTASLNKDNYSSPSWAMYQADKIGYERALIEVISLISDDSVEK